MSEMLSLVDDVHACACMCARGLSLTLWCLEVGTPHHVCEVSGVSGRRERKAGEEGGWGVACFGSFMIIPDV